MNVALLDKLKEELIAAKMQYAENQMELANVLYYLMQAHNESNKLKKRRESQINDVCKIVPGLIKLVIEESSDDSNYMVNREILNYEELAMAIKHAVVSEHSLKMEFTFKEEDHNCLGAPSVKKLKSNICD